MSSLRDLKGSKATISYPKNVNRKDIKANGLLLTDLEISNVFSKLKDFPDMRFAKAELKKLGLNLNYSIIKDKNRYFVVYKKHVYLGTGGQGKVKIAQYLGDDMGVANKNPIWSIGKLLAIKVVAAKNPNDQKEEKLIKRYLEQEQKILEKLGRAHTEIIERMKNGVRKYQFLQELMPGEELFEYLTEGKGRYITVKTAIPILYGAFSEMCFLHSKGILHCDIKLENAIYDPVHEKIYFVDMGVALIMDKEGKAHAVASGTLEFIAPEIYATKTYDEKTEIYPLGHFFKEVLSHIYPHEYADKTYRELKAVALAMFAKDRQARPTAEALAKMFEKLMKPAEIEKQERIPVEKKDEKIADKKIEDKVTIKTIDVDLAIAWINKSVRFELPEQYRKMAPRKKHAKHVAQLNEEFKKTLNDTVDLDNAERFQRLIQIVEDEYLRLQKKWCSPSLFHGARSGEEFVVIYLNQDMKNHHYTRMLGLILKTVYENYSDLLGDRPCKQLLNAIKPHQDYQFSTPTQKGTIKPISPGSRHSK